LKKHIVVLLKIVIPVAIIAYLAWDATNRAGGAFADEKGDFDPGKLAAVADHAWANWWWLAAAWVSCATAVTLTLVRWYYLVRALNLPLTFKGALRIGFLSYLVNLAPMGIVGGDLLRAWMLARQQQAHRTEAFATVVADRVIGLYTLFVVASGAILVTRFWRMADASIQWVWQLTLVLTAIGTAGMAVVLFRDISNKRFTRLVTGVRHVGPIVERFIGALPMYRRKMSVVLVAAVMSVGVHSLFTVGVFMIAHGLYDRVLSLSQHFVVNPLSAATGVIPLAMGPMEIVLNELYVHVTLPGGGMMGRGQGLVVALGYRIATMLIAVAGVCYYLRSRKEVAEVLHDAEEEADRGQTGPALVSETAA